MMQPSDTFRSRRPPSPHGMRQSLTTGLPIPNPRFQQQRYVEQGQPMGADEKLDAVRGGASPNTASRMFGSSASGPRTPGGALGKITSGEFKVLIAVVLVACAVRLFRLGKPNSVVFDEVHFGKFAAKYIRTRYYVDVHPPLAKLLLTLASFAWGFDGSFDFKDIGAIYPSNVPYLAMRFVPAILGVALVPITHLTLRELGCGASTALLGSVLVLFENGLITQSRHILLDSPLLFFTGLSTLFWVMFCNEDRRPVTKTPHAHTSRASDTIQTGPFSRAWWIYLGLTGLALGAVASCKWVGLFTIATVGFSTVKQLWTLLGDARVSPSLWIKHFFARAACLILIPLLFYMSMFGIHFSILRNSGDGDAFMTSEFQHTLQGKGMGDTYADVAFGSTVSIRHVNTQGGYLHSHAHNYPGGSKQQQITLYPHMDSNNDWRIMPMLDPVKPAHPGNVTDTLKTLTYLTPGSVFRLQHARTGKHLHSHDVRPPVSEVDFQQEVSGYGFEGFDGDANDNFILELDEEGGGDDGGRKGNGKGWAGDKESGKRLRTLRTKFLLRHQLTGCYLFSHKVKLPDWGFEQQEVTCNKNAVRKNSLWFVETNSNPLLPADAEKVNYKLPGFIGKWWELQKVMWRTNAGLTSRHAYDSRPWHWPTLRRGINFWVKDHRHIYLIGNPFTWWMSTAGIATYLVVRAFLILRQKRGYKDFHHSAVVKYDQMIGFLVMGWALHYLPFYLMGRQLFLHHYFPALWYAILTFASVFDLVTSTLSPRRRIQIAAVIMALAIWTYAHFSPLAYGNPWTKKHCRDAKWLSTWDFSCTDYLDDYSGYKALTPAVPGPDPTGQAPARIPPSAGTTHAPVAVNEPKKDADALTAEEHKEKVEPGHDAFQAPPADVINESLKAELAETGPNAPAGEVKDKERERKEEEEKKKMAVLEDQVGPLLPSDLAKVGERESKVVPAAEPVVPAAGEGIKEKEKVEEVEKIEDVKKEETEVNLTAVEHVVPKAGEPETEAEGEVKIQTAPHERDEA